MFSRCLNFKLPSPTASATPCGTSHSLAINLANNGPANSCVLFVSMDQLIGLSFDHESPRPVVKSCKTELACA